MKKIKMIFILSAAAAVLILNGCGSQKENSKREISNSSSQTIADDISKIKRDTTSEESDFNEGSDNPLLLESNVKKPEVMEFSIDKLEYYDSLEEYFESSTAQEVIKKITSEDNDNNSEKKIYIENETKLVIETTIKEKLESKAMEEFISDTKKSVTENAKVFTSFVDDLESCIKSDEINVVVRYKDYSGKTIYEHNFNNDLNDSSESSDDNSEAVSNPQTEENTIKE